jgi:hypothetical protein
LNQIESAFFNVSDLVISHPVAITLADPYVRSVYSPRLTSLLVRRLKPFEGSRRETGDVETRECMSV